MAEVGYTYLSEHGARKAKHDAKHKRIIEYSLAVANKLAKEKGIGGDDLALEEFDSRTHNESVREFMIQMHGDVCAFFKTKDGKVVECDEMISWLRGCTGAQVQAFCRKNKFKLRGKSK